MKNLSLVPSSKIVDLYTSCCLGLKRMTSLESKRFLIHISFQIYSLLDQQNMPLMKQTIRVDSSMQTDPQIIEVKKEIKTPVSQVSLKSRNESSLNIPEKDQVLEEAIQKYETLIESLYKQIQDMQQSHTEQIRKLKEEQQEKIKRLEQKLKLKQKLQLPLGLPLSKKQSNIRLQEELEKAELKKEIGRLEKQIRKRDKMLIKKIQNLS